MISFRGTLSSGVHIEEAKGRNNEKYYNDAKTKAAKLRLDCTETGGTNIVNKAKILINH